MDDHKIKKKLLVVGDSFMCPDRAYPGQHWSEMLPDYEILMYSISGASNGIIMNQFYSGMEQNPDAVVLGFTEINRIEFSCGDRLITFANKKHVTSEQQLLDTLYKVHAPHHVVMMKNCGIVACLLHLLEEKKIPYAWTLNLMFANLAHLPYPSDPWVNKILSKFFYRMTKTNLATYQGFKNDPGFHTDDPEWQQNFAKEVKSQIESIDFLANNS